MFESRVGEPRLQGERASCSLTIADTDFELYFEATGRTIRSSVDPFVISALLPAMRAGTPLTVEVPVSARLLARLPQIQTLLTTWRPNDLHPVEIRAEALPEEPARSPGKGAFLSLGIDSHYTLRKNEQLLTHLLMIRNFDVARLAPEIWDRISHNARRVAKRHGKELIEIDTNVRELDRGIGWAWLHGPALAAVAHSLVSEIGTVYISASQMDPPLGPWGTHPELDPLWSTDALEVVHFGPRSRVEKLLEIADDPMVLEALRVCISTEGLHYNCGRCEKCVGTMLTLDAIGKLAECGTFPDAVDPAAIRRLDLTKYSRNVYFNQSLDLLRRAGGSPEVIAALKRQLRAPKTRRALRPVISLLRRTR